MTRTVDDARRWMVDGTALLLDAVNGLDEDAFAAPSRLPGWSRKHLVAHLAANADALGNLVHWAATGEETAMYASPEDRAAGIERGPQMTGQELQEWLTRSAAELAAAMDQLSPEQWATEVRTAQGRTVPATEMPWMRVREVWVHAADLGTGVDFAAFPDELNRALCDDILAKRGMDGLPAEIAEAPLPQVTAWLAGRQHSLNNAPEIGAWL